MRVLVTGRGGGVLIAGGDAVEVEMRRICVLGVGGAPGSTLFPYTTLFRSVGGGGGDVEGEALHLAVADQVEPAELGRGQRVAAVRAEDDRSELQARGDAGYRDGNDRVGIDLRQ